MAATLPTTAMQGRTSVIRSICPDIVVKIGQINSPNTQSIITNSTNTIFIRKARLFTIDHKGSQLQGLNGLKSDAYSGDELRTDPKRTQKKQPQKKHQKKQPMKYYIGLNSIHLANMEDFIEINVSHSMLRYDYEVAD